jgi:hypothetical protein
MRPRLTAIRDTWLVPTRARSILLATSRLPPSRSTPGENTAGASQQTDRELAAHVPKPAVFQHGPRPLPRASSIDVDARLTPLDPSGKPAADESDSPVREPAPGSGTIAFLESDRPAGLRADERNGDQARPRPRRARPLPRQSHPSWRERLASLGTGDDVVSECSVRQSLRGYPCSERGEAGRRGCVAEIVRRPARLMPNSDAQFGIRPGWTLLSNKKPLRFGGLF